MNSQLKKARTLALVFTAILAAGVTGILLWNVSQRTRIQGTEVKLTEDDLVTTSELIVIGTPVKSKTRTVRDGTAGTLVFTDWTIAVQKTLKGDVPDPLVVTVPGGERFGKKTIVEEFDGFKKGTEYLLYLTYVPEGRWWTPLSATQAVFEKRGEAYVDATNRSQTLKSARAVIRQVTGLSQ